MMQDPGELPRELSPMEQSNNSRSTESADTDMLSSFPDCLLHHVMSFLTAIEAVRTCVLSKRWKNLWTTLPVLDFGQDSFEENMSKWCDSELEDGDQERLYVKMFRDFVNMTLRLRKPTNLLKFRLSCPRMSAFWSKLYVRSWIQYVLDKNPQVLDIYCATGSPLHVGIFSCASLVDLSLCCTCGDQISAVNLPCLRRLHLHTIDINQDFMNKLLCGCPVLESLHLMYCNMEVSTIHSQSLKYLIIKNRCAHLGGWADIAMELISAPNLLHLYYSDCGQNIGHNLLLDLPSLTSAIIFRERCAGDAPVSHNVKSKILTGISSVRSLKLAGDWMKELVENELPNLPKFQNVKDLSLVDFCLCCNFNLLASFLEHFPNLEILSFWHGSLCKVGVHGHQESLKIAPLKCKHLHTVNVNFFACNKNNVHRAMKYLKDYTKNLSAKINITDLARYPIGIWLTEVL